jgi:predicted aspartyl protease
LKLTPIKRFALPILFLSLVAHTLCHSQEQPSASAILEGVRQATGGDAWNAFAECSSEVNLTIAGKTGPGARVENLRTGAYVVRASVPELGVHQAYGVSPERIWRQGDEGYISLLPPEDSSQVDELYLVRHDYWQPDFGGATVRVLDATTENGVTFDRLQFQVPGGRGFTLWVNRANHFTERVVTDSSARYWSDYRRVDGVMLPFSQRSGSGTQELLFTVTKYALLKTVQDTDFAIPFQKDYQMPASGRVTVPAEDGITFRAKINGKGPYPLFFDTGSVNLLSADFAKQLGLKTDGKPVKFAAASGSVDAQTARVDTLQIGDLLLRDQTFYVISFPASGDEGPVGAVGYELMRRLAVKVDYEHNQLTFYDGPTFRYADGGVRAPLLIEGNVFEVAGSIEGLGATFLLDTGNEVAFEVEPGFVTQYNLIQRLGARYHGYSGRGYAGPTAEAYYARVKTLRLGDAEVHDVVANLWTGEPGAATFAGNIGRSVLRQFNVTFDAMRGAMYLEKNANWGKPVIFNRAGIVVDPIEDGEKVMTVLPGSPAESAGIAVGDLITRIDGRPPADDINDPAFLQPVGTRVGLTVKRGDAVRDVQVTLQELL